MYIRVSVYLCVRVYMCVHVCVCACIYTYLLVCVCVCVSLQNYDWTNWVQSSFSTLGVPGLVVLVILH